MSNPFHILYISELYVYNCAGRTLKKKKNRVHYIWHTLSYTVMYHEADTKLSDAFHSSRAILGSNWMQFKYGVGYSCEEGNSENVDMYVCISRTAERGMGI